MEFINWYVFGGISVTSISWPERRSTSKTGRTRQMTRIFPWMSMSWLCNFLRNFLSCLFQYFLISKKASKQRNNVEILNIFYVYLCVVAQVFVTLGGHCIDNLLHVSFECSQLHGLLCVFSCTKICQCICGDFLKPRKRTTTLTRVQLNLVWKYPLPSLNVGQVRLHLRHLLPHVGEFVVARLLQGGKLFRGVLLGLS